MPTQLRSLFTLGRQCRVCAWIAILPVLACSNSSYAQSSTERKFAEATELFQAFTSDDADAIPVDLLLRARGIAVIPNVFRGGFILGGRRGRGVLIVRTENGSWSNPAFVTLTGGSVGWQIGAESTDLVLVFANDNAVKNISSGKFTLGGDASAVAGPLGRHATMAVTFRAEVYGYVRSRGLFAGAAFEGARLDIDEAAGRSFYAGAGDTFALGVQSSATPPAARRFLLAIEQAAYTPQSSTVVEQDQEAEIFPLGN
jgi:lipid-binding SYLF domain-containing protein